MSKCAENKTDHYCMACQQRKTGLFHPVYRADGKFAYWRCDDCQARRSNVFVKEKKHA